ncbi:hypothetical protein [Photobacterium leiognathi]|uniref:hypothetical protein n=1 Tax=Photobacterium leiognathi TaxID=553611 RepID=UPI002733A823|nr:hypothetical protein [Photobacterium leiognathi]
MLLKLFGQSFLGSFMYAITQWLIISSISRILTIDDTGIYATILGVVVTINMFFNFGIRQIAYSTESDDVLYLTKYVFYLQFCGLIITIITCYAFYPNFLLLAASLYLHKIIETLSEYQYGVYQRTDLHKKIAISRILRSISYTGTFVVSLYFSKDLILSSFLMFITNLTVFIIVDKFTIK